MRNLIDADGDLGVDVSVSAGKNYGLEVRILCDTTHI